jgi:hypothetical protein
MNLEALGNIGDFVGGIAVIATLVYLAIQIRQSNRLVEQSTQIAHAQALREANSTQSSLLAIAQDAELSKIIGSGLVSYNGLSSDEQLRFTFAFGSLISALATNHSQQVTLGILKDSRISTQVQSLKGFLGAPGGKEWWEIFSAQYSDGFREYVKEQVLH